MGRGSDTIEEKHDILKLMLDNVYVDMPTRMVVGLEPKAEFIPLFKLCDRKLDSQRTNAGERQLVFVSGDPDGIRTRDLCLDRAVC